MTDKAETTPSVESRPPRDLRSVCVLGACLIIAAVLHARLPRSSSTSQPIHRGTVVGDVHVRESSTRVSHLKLGGCRAECYETFVVLYIDKSKQPTWTGNFIKVIPWTKIEHLTLE